MARAIAADGTRPWRCPICDAEGHGTNWATDRALSQHIAMMDGAMGKEGAHTDWRREHNISPLKMVAQYVR
jgi:hypothetical protein